LVEIGLEMKRQMIKKWKKTSQNQIMYIRYPEAAANIKSGTGSLRTRFPQQKSYVTTYESKIRRFVAKVAHID
jgi:hypothetical protein